MKRNGSLFLLMLTALIWGSAFVAQSVGNDLLGPLSFNALRSFIGALALLPVAFYAPRLLGEKQESRPQKQNKKDLWLGGVLCGLVLAAASSLQQWGLLYAAVGKAGFITAMYIVIVPVLGIFVKRAPGAKVWAAVGIAVAGLYLLCWSGSGLDAGDLLLFGCSGLFSLHILVIDHFSPRVDGVKMSCIQFFTAGVVCILPALLLEQPSLAAVLGAAGPLLYAGVLSSGVGYTLQILAQRRVEPTLASLVLSLESVFSVLAGWVLLGQTLTLRELLGCALMFAAILLAQMPEKQRKAA